MLSWQRHGVALTICELGNGALCAPFQGSRADAKQMRGKRSSAVSTAREAVTTSEACFGVVTEGVTAGITALSLASLTLFPQIFCFAKSLREPYPMSRPAKKAKKLSRFP